MMGVSSASSAQARLRNTAGMHRLEAMGDAVQALRVRDEQVAARLEVPLEHRHHPLLDGLVEIDHHVAAEDEVELPAERGDLEQVQGAEVDLAGAAAARRAPARPVRRGPSRSSGAAAAAARRRPWPSDRRRPGPSPAPWSRCRRRAGGPRRGRPRAAASGSCRAPRRSSTPPTSPRGRRPGSAPAAPARARRGSRSAATRGRSGCGWWRSRRAAWSSPDRMRSAWTWAR